MVLRKPPFIHESCQGDVYENTSKPNWYKQQGFKILLNTEVEKNSTHDHHHSI